MSDSINKIFTDKEDYETYLSFLSSDELNKIKVGIKHAECNDGYQLIQSMIELKEKNPSYYQSFPSRLGKWIKSHIILSIIILIIFVIIFLPSRGKGIGDPAYILFLSIPGLIPLVGMFRGYASIFRKGFYLFTSKVKIQLLILSAILLIIFLIGFIPFLFIAYTELSIQLTCSGGGCAQGGMVLFFCIPAPWLSHLIVRLLNSGFSRLWPFVLKPDFSVLSSAFSLKNEIALSK